ncbi:uncharacterized protein Z518_11233 [Rhinocladiella mackenziei CBS 650.93]|uniref:SWIM-type domain-containing protein n=1 Tax=Rhinocladiella mackenziei CBS 650.93 TaxID=1442369 RepID=A0A0D2IS06_9EURO|nr:uncharacterized protein Z518_11233 [Rhinocladiella mackenziei CBS 650.93]KIW99494.1 hypothetical protein Z518_11233 [Rhinocladiella mackenziei CBS 650.93]
MDNSSTRLTPASSCTMLTSIFNGLSTLTPLSHSSSSHKTQAEPPRLSLTSEPVHSLLYNLSPADAEHARSLFLTLHVLFPHELLPALDLLDRRLVTRLTTQNLPPRSPGRRGAARDEDADVDTAEKCEMLNKELKVESRSDMCEVYYIHSHPSKVTTLARYHARNANPGATFYEVHLDSWNCSCPAFSVSAFQALNMHYNDEGEIASKASQVDHMHEPTTLEKESWSFGGVATNVHSSTPSCKHILAAVLVKAAPKLFNHGVRETVVSRDELAGWGGGWGALGTG